MAIPGVIVPENYPASLIYADTSGSLGQPPMVMAAVKVRRHGELARDIRQVRETHQYFEELKFNRVSKKRLPMYRDLADVLSSADIHVAATVVAPDAVSSGVVGWKIERNIAVQLLAGCINRTELVSVVIDDVSTPQGVGFEDQVRLRVNRKHGSMSVVAAACMDSRSNDGLQIADLYAGAIRYRRVTEGPSRGSHRDEVSGLLLKSINLADAVDTRNNRANIVSLRPRKRRRDTSSSTTA